MKQTETTADNLLVEGFAPEAEAYLDELERSGQFRVGLEAEIDDAEGGEAASNDYSLARGSGSAVVQDWWTTGRVSVRVASGILPEDLCLARVNDSLVVRSRDGLDRVTFENYLGLIPDASTLRIIFADGTEWAGEQLRSRISDWMSVIEPAVRPDIQ